MIFLLDGHALGGYWRDPEAHKNFCRGLYPDDPISTSQPTAVAAPAKGTPHPWCFNKDDYPRVRTWFDVGALVAVEATALTDPKGGFRNSVAKGGTRSASSANSVHDGCAAASAAAQRRRFPSSAETDDERQRDRSE